MTCFSVAWYVLGFLCEKGRENRENIYLIIHSVHPKRKSLCPATLSEIVEKLCAPNNGKLNIKISSIPRKSMLDHWKRSYWKHHSNLFSLKKTSLEKYFKTRTEILYIRLYITYYYYNYYFFYKQLYLLLKNFVELTCRQIFRFSNNDNVKYKSLNGYMSAI